MQIHERIKAERIKKGLSEDDIAGKLDIPRSTYQYWETKTPSVEKIKAVAVALGLAENYFFINDEKISDKNDEIIGNPKGDHGTHVAGTALTGRIVLVDAKDLTASYERIIEEKERIIRLIESQIEKAEKEKEKLFKALENAQTTINEVLKPIKEQTAEILSNSKKVNEGVRSLKTEIVAEHGEMMETLDQIAGNEPGTTAARAGTVELGHRLQSAQKGKKANTGKKD
jgi:transcriptional regulator with XRE-family HTH domain